ncbi:uncharacterized protein LOC113772268 [Coffea eugenioides]|uniref:uncharacterized protein LOC113772268 n=1 Tax=Coffea eugenioides TaxID=49369 RepID=UPI000F60BC9C|nr:uncharacterized protein LOC113772268 [Coffea eugenioides]
MVIQASSMDHGQYRINITIIILWQIWKARNKKVFERINPTSNKIVKKAQEEWIEYELTKETEREEPSNAAMSQQQQQQSRRKTSKEGVIKLHIDAVISARMIRTRQDIIARNWIGEIVKAKGIVHQRKSEASIVEALAIRNALVMAKDAGWTKIEVYTDCKSVVDQINTRIVNNYNIATVLEDIQELRQWFQSCSFSFVHRAENRCSHELAQFASKT